MKTVLSMLFLNIIGTIFSCTIGVASGDITTSGKPMIWKNRDFASHTENIVLQSTDGVYTFTAVIWAEENDYTAMGINQEGFGIINSLSNDIDVPEEENLLNNIDLIRYALKNFSTISEFEQYLDHTNEDNIRMTRGNFGVIDALGNAVLYEVGHDQYLKFDTNNEEDCPEKYIVRTNFSTLGGGMNGFERYFRARDIVNEMISTQTLSTEKLMQNFARDFSTQNAIEIALPFDGYWNDFVPYGYIDTQFSINNHRTVAAAIIEGVNNYDNRKQTTMWTALGNPVCSTFIPIRVDTPLSTPLTSSGESGIVFWANKIRNELYDLQNFDSLLQTQKLKSAYSTYLEDIFLFEKETILNVNKADSLHKVNYDEMQQITCEMALQLLQDKYFELTQIVGDSEGVNEPVAINFYPNPLHHTNVLKIESNRDIEVESFIVYNIKGQKVGEGKVENRKINLNENLSSGIFFVKMKSGKKTYIRKLTKIK